MHPSSSAPFSLYALRDGSEQCVDFIALAEFDIDLGTVVRAKVPADDTTTTTTTPGNQYLCEQMLPDRSEGYASQQVVFFANRAAEDEASEASTLEEIVSLRVETYRGEGSSWTRLHNQEEVISFASVSASSQMGKAAMHRSLAEIFVKDANGGALQSYVISPQVGVSLVPHGTTSMITLSDTGCGFPLGLKLLDSPFGEEGLPGVPTALETLQAWLRGEKSFKKVAPSGAAPPWGANSEETPFLYCLSITKTRRDSSVRRGAVIKAVSIGCRNPVVLYAFQPILDDILTRCLSLKEGGQPILQQQALEEVYRVLNDKTHLALPESLEGVSYAKWAVWKDVIRNEARVTHETTVHIVLPDIPLPENDMQDDPCEATTDGAVSHTIRIPLYTTNQHLCEASGRVATFLDTFRESALTIVSEILLGHRVLFLSYKKSAGELSSILMAAVSLALPLSRRYLHTRTFPYSSLTCMQAWTDLGACTVGITNPMFESRTEWWDVLCNLDTGKIKHRDKEKEKEREKEQPEADATFLTRMLAGKGRNAAEVEPFLRYHFADYLASMTREGADSESILRVKRWGQSGILQPVESTVPACIRGARQSLQKLRSTKELSEEDAILIFQSLVKTVRETEDLMHLLSLLPKEADGLFPIALGLFHPSHAVKLPCVAFLRRLDTFPEGKLVMHSLNPYLLIAYERNAKLMPIT